MDTNAVAEWGIERSADLLALVDAACPHDRLSLDELETACWGHARTVLGFADGSGAVSVRFEGAHAVIGVLAATESLGAAADTRPPVADQRSALLDAAIRATNEGARWVVVGGSMPDHLWPGLTDLEDPVIDALVSRGFHRAADVDVLCVPTVFRARVPDGYRIERVVDDDLVERSRTWIGDREPTWAPVVARAAAQATAFVAVEEATQNLCALVVHSVGRDGWIGPIEVATDHRTCGLGSALLAEACRDLLIAGRSEAPLACTPDDPPDDATSGAEPPESRVGAPWPADFLTVVGARPWRTFQRYALLLS